VRGYAFLTAAGFGALFVIMATYFYARDFARRATLAVFSIVSRPLAEKLATEAERLAHGLDFLSNGRAAVGFMFETTLYWVTNAASMWVLAWAAGMQHTDGSAPTFAESFALMGMLGVTILIPGPPGMLGIFQAGVFCGMTMYYPADIVKDRGAVYACLLFLIQVGLTVITASVAFLSGHTSLKAMADEDRKLGP
jgi:uncharacterized membrane protein YbhN (UPF0104 family)